MHRCPDDREARYLDAASRGSLIARLQFGAVLGLVDRSTDSPAYLPPPPARPLDAGWLAWDTNGERLILTPVGGEALREYARHLAFLETLPRQLIRNPLHEEPHNPREPIRRLRSIMTGEEIDPGDTVRDPSGHPVTYLGPIMHSHDGGATWTPGHNARVLYADHGAWLWPPSEVGAVFDPDPGSGSGGTPASSS